MKNGDAITYNTVDGKKPGFLLELEAPRPDHRTIAIVAYKEGPGLWLTVRCEMGAEPGMFGAP